MLIDDIIVTMEAVNPCMPELDLVFVGAHSEPGCMSVEFAVPRKQFIDWLKNEAPTATYKTYEIISDTLNIRQAPSFTSKVLGRLVKGARVTVDQELNGLYRLAGGWGWISNSTKYVKQVGK